MRRFYTAESVTEGHPDKLCDRIADAVLDECLKEDSESRAACEVLVTRGHLLVAGEITSKHEPYVPEIVKKILEDTGYQAEDITIDVQIHKQSPDIARAVDHPQGRRKGLSEEAEARGNGAGDQGVMIGYACNETAQLMPMPAVLAHRIVRELSACRRSEYIQGLLPDGKAQVTVEYENGKSLRVDSVIVSCQHAGDKNLRKLEQEIRNKVLFPALRPLSADEDTRIYINPSGRFVCGGLNADTGVTGRKLMVDSYSSMVPHGGGAFSGKDCSKVDRSGAYMARYIAKNLVTANLADRCQVSLAYVIGMAEPVMVQVETFGTGRVCADDCLAAAIPLVFGLSPKQICDTFRLKRPIFQRTAVYGHFGRKEFPWERIDKTEELRNAVM
jgi:S-adenosylmethionine synthetase